MHTLDWLIIGVYLAGMLALAAWLSRRQKSGKDYFLGNNTMGPLPLATSTIATQCSTNSLLGAPAFVGFSVGGGLLWLQYELAVPLAMLLLIGLLATVRRSGHISIYAFLEERLGRRTRLLASLMFLVFRGIATGVTVYGVASMVTLILDIGFTEAVLLLMAITITYDVLGGMRAVVYSDVMQMVLILLSMIAALVLVVDNIGGWQALVSFQQDSPRGTAIDMSWGVNGSGNFGFWPMLFGGLFLYMAYYGCDQSQAQRLLASKSSRDTERVLVLAGILRFPVVALYCALGLALAVYASLNSGFVTQLPVTAQGTPNYNMVVPTYVLEQFPIGLVGLVMVGIIAAAMSSIDSALNALSAATMQDFLPQRRHSHTTARYLTVGWGLFAVVFSYQVEAIAPTLLEAINKIGSVANGPLLALFLLAWLKPRVGERNVLIGFAAGFSLNISLWLFADGVSWLWWNVTGCLLAIALALLLPQPANASSSASSNATGAQQPILRGYATSPVSALILVSGFIAILTIAISLS